MPLAFPLSSSATFKYPHSTFPSSTSLISKYSLLFSSALSHFSVTSTFHLLPRSPSSAFVFSTPAFKYVSRFHLPLSSSILPTLLSSTSLTFTPLNLSTFLSFNSSHLSILHLLPSCPSTFPSSSPSILLTLPSSISHLHTLEPFHLPSHTFKSHIPFHPPG
jgi:hypothetical protein